VLESANEKDTLEILPNGQYRHTQLREHAESFSEAGTWSFAQRPEGPAVQFSKFTPVQLPYTPTGRGWWLALLARDRSGRVTLGVNSDLGLSFIRIK
jgi:hypothetical protein